MNRYFSVFILLFGLASQPDVAAVTLYTWVDAQGVRHYSQFPPADDEQAIDTQEVEIPNITSESSASAPSPENRTQTILDVARDLEDSRLQREQQRADQAAAYAADKAATSSSPQNYDLEPDAIFLPYPYGRPYPPHAYPPGPHPPWNNMHPKPGKPGQSEPRPPRSRIIMPPAEERPSAP